MEVHSKESVAPTKIQSRKNKGFLEVESNRDGWQVLNKVNDHKGKQKLNH